MHHLRIGLIGLGTVGSGVLRLLRQKSRLLAERSGLRLELARVCEKDLRKIRGLGVPRALAARNANQILRDPSIQCVVELIGGTKAAKRIVLEALRRGKDVVTANKALLAEHGREIFEAARRHGRRVFFEASVCGGVPIIKNIRESLIANRVDSLYGIVNGTSNSILSEMAERGISFDEALKLAQAKGYAERDPRLDIEGIDAAHKLTILASLIFESQVNFKEVSCEGIRHIADSDMAFADEFGYAIKLLAIAKRTAGQIEARVCPTLLPKGHILASVRGSFNAVYLRGDEVGDMLFYGRGAGSHPTASAVVSDLIDWAREAAGERKSLPPFPKGKINVKGISSILSRYYLRFFVVDRPGVLSKISGVFGRHGVSISDVTQREEKKASVPLIFLTHAAHEGAVRQAVREIDRLNVVRGKSQVLRIEE